AAPPPIAELNPNVPPAVIAVVMKALEKSPRKRYQSAHEMADALMKAKEGRPDPNTPQLGERATAPSPGKTSPPPRQRTATASQTARFAAVKKRRRNISTTLTVLTVCLVLIGLIFGSIAIYRAVTDSAIAPDLVGLAVEDAQALVKRAGLNWQQTEVNHDKIPKGTVIGQTPQADVEMRKGDSVVVSVSLGPLQLLAPNVTGLTRDEAAARLKDKGLSMVVSKSPSTEPVDTVIAQNPLEGEPCSAGQEIAVTLSGGSTLVPDLFGKTYEEALQLITENKLTAGKVVYGVATDDQIGKVLTQSPAAGTMAVLDTQVTLTVGAKSKPYRADMEVDIPAGTDSVPLRVILVENGVEVEQYNGMTTTGAAYSIIIPVSSTFSGSLACRAYLNGQLIAEKEVTLQ
ncbi:MAG: PASTA domain-containing protein, partial [Eubacteriales bacterium]|nr:PASTA domain-containing protein [Eubacteriales bacterium]